MRKANASTMQATILAALFIILLMVFLGNYRSAAVDTMEIKKCEESVKAQDRLRLRGLEMPTEFNCPTRYHQVEEKEDDQIKQKLAGYMFDCWNKMGKGDIELFYEDTHFCLVCDHIIFEEKKRVEGFSTYLLTKNVPTRDLTYADYFHKYESSNSDFILQTLESNGNAVHVDEFVIDTSKPHIVLFTYIKGRSQLEEFYNDAIYAAPGAGAAAAGVGIMKVGGIIMGAPVPGARFIGVPTFGIGAVVAAGGLAAGIAGAWFDRANPQWAAFVELKPFNTEELKNAGCKELPAGQVQIG